MGPPGDATTSSLASRAIDPSLQQRGCPAHEGAGYVEFLITPPGNPFGTWVRLPPGANRTIALEAHVCKRGFPPEVGLTSNLVWHSAEKKPRPPPEGTPEVLQPARLTFHENGTSVLFHVHVIVPSGAVPGTWTLDLAPRDWSATRASNSVGIDVGAEEPT